MKTLLRVCLHDANGSSETIEAIAVDDPPSPARYAEWQTVWTRCAQLEKGFWDMALHLL